MEKKSEWLFRVALMVLMGIASYLAKANFDELKQFNNEIDSRVRVLETGAAATSGNRFTSGDWAKASETIYSQINAQDKRLQRLEDSIPVIRDTLVEIKSDLRDLTHNNETKGTQ